MIAVLRGDWRVLLQATSHWETDRHQPLSTEVVRKIVSNARQIKGMLPPQLPPSHNHQLSRDASRRRSLDVHTMDQSPGLPAASLPSHSSDVLSAPPPPSIVKINVLDAPHFQLPNQENRLALVLDPLRDRIPFTFGVEMFPPGALHELPLHSKCCTPRCRIVVLVHHGGRFNCSHACRSCYDAACAQSST